MESLAACATTQEGAHPAGGVDHLRHHGQNSVMKKPKNKHKQENKRKQRLDKSKRKRVTVPNSACMLTNTPAQLFAHTHWPEYRRGKPRDNADSAAWRSWGTQMLAPL